MRSTIRIIVLTTLISLCLANNANAGDYADSGSYVFLGGLTAFENFSNKSGSSLDDSLGFDIRVGYRFIDYFAAEVSGNFNSGFDGKVANEGGIGIVSSEGGNITVNVRGIYPFGRFEPYALVGIGGMWSNVMTGTGSTGSFCADGYGGWWCDGNSVAGKTGAFISKFGTGADFWVTDNFAISMDAAYLLTTGALKDQNSIKLGWAARFRF